MDEGMPTDVVQLVSLVVSQAIVLAVYLVVFALMRWRRPELFEGTSTADGPIARQRTVFGWALAAVRLDEHALFEAGGVDGVLHCRAAAMHLRIAAALCATSLPLLLVYALAPATEPDGAPLGLSRLALTHVLSAERVAAWPLWIAVVCVWANTLYALHAIDTFDASAHVLSLARARATAGLHHYAVLVSNLPAGTGAARVRDFFEGVYGADAVADVFLLRSYAARPAAIKPVPPVLTGAKRRAARAAEAARAPRPAPPGGLLARLTAERHSVRSATAAYARALADVANAEAAVSEAARSGKLPEGAPDLEEEGLAAAGALRRLLAKRDVRVRVARARERAANVRAALQDALRLLPSDTDAHGGGGGGVSGGVSSGGVGVQSRGSLGSGSRDSQSFSRAAEPQRPTGTQPLLDGGQSKPLSRDAAAASAASAAASGAPPARAAIVHFDSLAIAAAAARGYFRGSGCEGDGRPYDATDAWTVRAAPEPRALAHAAIERLMRPGAQRRARLGFAALKLALFTFWSVLVGALGLGAQAVLALLARLPSAPLRLGAAIASGIVPVVLANLLLVLMAPVLRELVLRLGGALSEAEAGAAVVQDYSNFLIVVAFFAPMLATSIFAVALQLGQDPLSILPLLAGAVPASSTTFMQLVLLKAVGLGADATGIVPALVRLAKAKLLNAGRTPFSRAELARPPDKAETVRACWMSWVQLVLVVYAPLAPLCSAFCLVFAACALLAARVETALGARPHFDSAGLLAAVVARRALLNVAIGALVHLAVLGLAGARGEYSHVFALAPIPLPIAWARARLLARQRDGLHGARGAGRLPLRDAAALDATRPRAHVRAALGAFGHELCAWAPPCGAEGASTAARLVGSAVAQPTAAGALPPPDGEEAQAALSGWLRRYERADAVEYRAQVGAALAAAALTA